MKKLFLWALSALLTLPAATQDFVPEASFYGENYWTPDTLGNHRAIVSVNTPASVAEAYIPWRRRDANPEQKGIIVINASTGKAVDNVLPVEINREYGRIRFDASGNAGDYYVYYLPYHTSGGPYPKVNHSGRKGGTSQAGTFRIAGQFQQLLSDGNHRHSTGEAGIDRC